MCRIRRCECIGGSTSRIEAKDRTREFRKRAFQVVHDRFGMWLVFTWRLSMRKTSGQAGILDCYEVYREREPRRPLAYCSKQTAKSLARVGSCSDTASDTAECMLLCTNGGGLDSWVGLDDAVSFCTNCLHLFIISLPLLP